tara:strand:- start:43 stop:762 length:720 start_codon:yes stop_codon:yes gene_type:complete
MEKTKKIKLIIGLFYAIFLAVILVSFFSNFTIQEITSYEFIKDNRNFFLELRQTNLLLLGISFIIFTIIWVLAAGFGAPIALISGFIFGKWFGVFFVLIGMSVGASLLYILANFFLKDLIRERFIEKYKNLDEKFKKSEFLYLLIYRFIGGIPFAISNVLPCIFNVKVLNFFWATLIGIFPQIFLICSIGNGLEKIIDQNLNPPGIIDIIFFPDIYIPLIIFIILVAVLFFFRKKFYKE